MKINKTQKDILYISISSFILVVAWIIFNIYHTAVTSTISPDLQMQIQPIDPSFDTTTIQKLKLRKRINPVYETSSSSAEINITPTIGPQILPTPIADQSFPSPTISITTSPIRSSVSGSLKPTTSIERVGR